MTVTSDAVIMVTADGETRDARTYADGSYACPFCSAAVLSPDGWADMQRCNAEIYARQGETYAPEAYPRSMRLVWDIRGCPNPACIILMNPARLAAHRQYVADRAAEEASRKRSHKLAMERIAEDKTRRQAACDEARERCQADGTCYRCWYHSTFGGMSDAHVKTVRHRDPANCPRVRRYG